MMQLSKCGDYWPITTILLAIWLGSFTRLSGQDFPIISKDAESVAASPAESETGLAFLNEGQAPTSIEQLRLMEQAFADVIERVSPATVNIILDEAQGSGVIVSREGHVLTAAHVIGRPNRLATITFPDGSKAKAVTLGVHTAYDSGMLKITDEGKWPFLEIGESQPLQRGQWVMAIGHPGGLTEGRGLVYRVGRILNNFAGVISTDCTLVGGDSGGPLVDLNGDVVGIHSRIGAQLAENFHVPIDVYSADWDQYIAGAIVDSKSPYLGVNLKREGRQTTNEVDAVVKRESAANAGILVGDFIIRIGETEISSGDDLLKALRDKKPNDVVVVTVKRGDEEIELDVTLGYKDPR